MKIANKRTHLSVFFLAALAALSVVHYLGYLLPYTYGIVQMMTGLMAVTWMATILWRVTDRNIRMVLMGIAGNLLLLFVLQNSRYNFFDGMEDVRRFLWYGFYIPMIMIPFLCFLMANNMDRSGISVLNFKGITLVVPAFVLIALIMTNDYHQLAFTFRAGIEKAASDHGFGPVYFLYLLWAIGLLAVSIVLMLRKSLVNGSTRQLVSLIPPLSLLVLFMTIYFIQGHFITINGIAILTLGDLYGLTTVWILEAFMKIGLIPANHYYGDLFRKTPISALITDGEGEPRYSSGISLELTKEQRELCVKNGLNLGENTRLSGKAITNGWCFWTDDMTKVNELEQSLRSVLAGIEAQNEILRSENEVIKQRERLQAQNLLYDRIATIVHPQAEKILELLKRAREIPEERNDCIAGIMGYNSYIKRRSNLELIRYMGHGMENEKATIPLEELRLSMIESLRCLELYGTETFLTGGTENRELDAAVIIAAYETIEALLEENVLHTEVMSVHLEAPEEALTLRLLIHLEKGAALVLRSDELSNRLHRELGVVLQVYVREEEDDYTVKLSFRKGGGAV